MADKQKIFVYLAPDELPASGNGRIALMINEAGKTLAKIAVLSYNDMLVTMKLEIIGLSSETHELRTFPDGAARTDPDLLTALAKRPRLFLYDAAAHRPGDRFGVVIREDGALVAQHVSSSRDAMLRALGRNGIYAEKYEELYHEGYELVVIPEGEELNHPGCLEARRKGGFLPETPPTDVDPQLKDDPPALVSLLVQRALEHGLYSEETREKAIKGGEYVLVQAVVAHCETEIPELGVCTYAGDIIPLIRRADHISRPTPLFDPPAEVVPRPGTFTIAKVGNCARCQTDHLNVTAKPFKEPPEGWTHWATCPTTKEPILVQSSIAVEATSTPNPAPVSNVTPTSAADAIVKRSCGCLLPAQPPCPHESKPPRSLHDQVLAGYAMALRELVNKHDPKFMPALHDFIMEHQRLRDANAQFMLNLPNASATRQRHLELVSDAAIDVCEHWNTDGFAELVKFGPLLTELDRQLRALHDSNGWAKIAKINAFAEEIADKTGETVFVAHLDYVRIPFSAKHPEPAYPATLRRIGPYACVSITHGWIVLEKL